MEPITKVEIITRPAKLDELKEAMPEIDLLLGVREYETLPRLLGGKTDAPHCGPKSARVLTTPRYSAYLRIADGCNNRCT